LTIERLISGFISCQALLALTARLPVYNKTKANSRPDFHHMATKHLITVEEFSQMETADNEWYELVDGELIPLPSPTPLHGIIRDRIARLIGNYFDRNPIGGAIAETDCRVIGETVRRPDLSIFLADRWQQLDLKTVPVPSAPDIAVEVCSPCEHVIDVTRKVREYLASGAQEGVAPRL
jgi:Uma2 family endonuclease